MAGLPPRGPAPQPQPQPQPTWNHLQVPNYYPRQPQAAHMSSDRPLSHSPLTWHTPTPPEHQQSVKTASNLFRHTPTPPSHDVQILKTAPNPMYRHTPTPPDREPALKAYRHTPTPPDGQNAKSASNSLYRHTPTPPEIVHGMKGGVSLYRHTPPPDGPKGVANPLFNLQQMISDRSQARTESLRDNMMVRGDSLGFSRHSPGAALSSMGSMDLSVTRSPRNGNQNGDLAIPMSLSVRDATKINNLDSTEITKLHQVSSFVSKNPEHCKSSSPTLNSMNQSSNSPKSPKSANKRPVKKVDSILERLNSGSDGVVITPVQHTPSPHSVIVSAHTLEDSNSRGSSSSFNIMPIVNASLYPPCETSTSIERGTVPLRTNPENVQITNISTIYTDSSPIPIVKEPPLLESQTVIKESTACTKEDLQSSIHFSNEDSNGSSSDSSKSRRRRKQLKTTRVESGNSLEGNHEELTLLSAPQNISSTKDINLDNGNHSENEVCRITVVKSQEPETVLHSTEQTTDKNVSIDNGVFVEKVESKVEENAVSVLSNVRRRISSDAETIDNIAAVIASTNPADVNVKNKEFNLSQTSNLPIDASQKSPVTAPPLAEDLNQVLGSPQPEPVNLKEENAIVDSTDGSQRKEAELPVVKKQESDVKSTEDFPSIPGDNIKTHPKTTTCFVEVENELEKMFAGIEESKSDSVDKSLDPVSGLITEGNTELLNDAPPNIESKMTRKKRSIRKNSDATSSGLLSSDENTPKKKQKLLKRKSVCGEKYNCNASPAGNSKKMKTNIGKKTNRKLDQLPPKDSYDSGSNASSSKSRGPYVQIRGPRDSPLSVSVINTPIHEEDVDKPLQKIKTLKAKTSLAIDSNFRNKVKSKGLHTSTLSMKYDATTTDTSWICVFCKKGPHTGPTHHDINGSLLNGKTQHMGDLFGPYIISTECPDYTSMMNDPHDTLFKGKLKLGTFMQNKQSMRGKKIKLDIDLNEDKTIFPNEEMYIGMTEAGTNSFEVWLHEDCAVWAPGLYLVGAKIVGLDAAVWSCCTMRCDFCSFLGATVACIKRGCQKKMHVNCARAESWSLSEDNFLVYCREHGLP